MANSSSSVDYLQIFENDVRIDLNHNSFPGIPSNYKLPYSTIGDMVGNFTFEKFLLNRDIQKQVIEYRTEKNYSLVLKRLVTMCNISDSSSILSNPEMREFLNSALKEFVITRIISTHPAGIIAFDFKVTFVTKQYWLITEFLMEKAGMSLSEYISDSGNKYDFIKILTQLASVMNYMESMKIYHSDIKLDNILIDSQGNLRIIDYGVSKLGSYYSKSANKTINQISGYTNGFVPPEVYKAIEEAIKNNTDSSLPKILPWKADIYSCGIVGLCISGALNLFDIANITDLDTYKENETKHQKIIDKCNKIDCNDPLLTQKMQFVLKVCLSYDPKQRINFSQFDNIMKKIKDNDYDLIKLQTEIENYRKETPSMNTLKT